MKLFLTTLMLILLTIGCFISLHNSKASANSIATCVNIAATPDYLSSNLQEDAIAAINHARALEHLKALSLPIEFNTLDVAHQQFVLINLERTDRGLKALNWDSNLATVAVNYSKQMRDLNFFSHTSPLSGSFETREDSNPTIAGHFSYAAENIAGNPVASAGAVYEYMYNDVAEGCGHRNNILNKNLTMVGIGEVEGGMYGSMSAQEFLASAPWNPYKSVTPGVTALTITALSGKISHGFYPLVSQVHTNNPKVQVAWFMDTIHNKAQMGKSIKVDIRHLSHGLHTIYAYAVNDIQNYSMTRIQISI